MPPPDSDFTSYAIQYSANARTTRRGLPPEVQAVLFDVVEQLADDPEAFAVRTRTLGRDGKISIYTHPDPPLEITYEVDPKERLLLVLHVVRPVLQVAKPLFISYSHKDERWLLKLKTFLAPLEEQGLVRIWDDTEIKPGMEWLAEIKTGLESARVAVLLVSQDFLSSEFIKHKEMPSVLKGAKERGLVIYWIAVSSSTVGDTVISKYQAANNPARPLDKLDKARQNQVLTEIYQKLKSQLDSVGRRPGPN